MRFTIEIDCSDAAFDDGNLMQEIASILADMRNSNEFRSMSRFTDHAGPLRDSNGNRVGHWAYEHAIQG
jgi:hypothetical protein